MRRAVEVFELPLVVTPSGLLHRSTTRTSVLDLSPALTRRFIDRIPELHPDRLRAFGRKHILERQRGLMEFILDALQGRYPHKTITGASFYGHKRLRERLRSKGTLAYVGIMRLCFEFPNGNDGHNAERGLARPYRLRPRIRQLAEEVLQETQV